MELRAGDRGKDARVVMTPKPASSGWARTAAFASRNSSPREQGAQRDVNVRVEQVTIGVRGTDFWGRSRDARQIVCLIEGAIEVGAGKGALRRGGRFNLELATAEKQPALRKILDELRPAGYPAEMQRRQDGFAVRIRHFPTREEAQMQADQLRGHYGIREATVTR